MLDAEMAAARLLAVQRIQAHELRQLEKIRDSAGVLERLIELLAGPGNEQVAPELLAKLRDLLQRLFESLRAARHAAVLPHELPQLAVKGLTAALPANREEARGPFTHGCDGRA